MTCSLKRHNEKGQKRIITKPKHIHWRRVPHASCIFDHLGPSIIIVNPALDRASLAYILGRLLDVIHGNIARADLQWHADLTGRDCGVPVVRCWQQCVAPTRSGTEWVVDVPARAIEEGGRERVDEVVSGDTKGGNFLERSAGAGVHPGGRDGGVLVDETFVLVLVVVLVIISLVVLLVRFGDALPLACTPKYAVSGNVGILGWRLRGEGVPGVADLGLEVGDENVADEFVAEWAGEDGVDVVLGDGMRVFHVGWVEGGFDGDVGEVVELGNAAVPVVRTVKEVCFVDLRTEVAQKEDCRGVWTEEDRANESLVVLHHLGSAARSQPGGGVGDVGGDSRRVLTI